MTLVAGASRYLGQVAAAKFGGSAFAAPSILGEGSSAGMSLLESARSLAVGGFGISKSARALNAQFISQSQSLGNQILSLAVGTDATIHGARQEILAMRSHFSDSQLAPSLRRGATVDTEA